MGQSLKTLRPRPLQWLLPPLLLILRLRRVVVEVLMMAIPQLRWAPTRLQRQHRQR
jgi:hypothetical protein